MVTKDQIVNGLVQYIDNEIMPYLSTSGKWVLGSAVTLSLQNVDEIYRYICNTPYFKMIKVVDNNGLIDFCKLCNALKDNASKYGKLQKQIPLIGTLTFSDQDVEKLRQYVDGGNS